MIIRQAYVEDAAGIAKVHIDTWRTTYAGIVPAEHLANLSYEKREKIWAQRLSNPGNKVFYYVVEDDSGGIIGFVNGGPERTNDPDYKGELYAIYILKQYQGQGLGHRLVSALAKSLLSVGMDSMLLWVLADNPASRFYESLGGQQIKSKQEDIGGATLEELAYGWKDIRVLLTKSS
jgi:ribosomal protein S18 acetylase RimI-like enzyme